MKQYPDYVKKLCKSLTSSHKFKDVNDRNDQGRFSQEHQWNRIVRNVKSQSKHD